MNEQKTVNRDWIVKLNEKKKHIYRKPTITKNTIIPNMTQYSTKAGNNETIVWMRDDKKINIFDY